MIKKTLSKLRIRKELPLDNECLQKPILTSYIMVRNEAFSKDPRNKTRIPPLTTAFQHHNGSPSKVIRQKKEID